MSTPKFGDDHFLKSLYIYMYIYIYIYAIQYKKTPTLWLLFMDGVQLPQR